MNPVELGSADHEWAVHEILDVAPLTPQGGHDRQHSQEPSDADAQ
jgi:hypothetical protein